MAKKKWVYEDYKPGDKIIVTRKNHHRHGQKGIVLYTTDRKGVLSVYVKMDDKEEYYFAPSSIGLLISQR